MATRAPEQDSPIHDDSLFSESVTAFQPDNDVDESGENAEAPNTAIGKKESQEVYHFKIIVLILLFIAAIVTATWVYIFISQKEEDDFTEHFQQNAAKVLDAVGSSIDQTLIPMDSLAVDLVSYARATDSPWPFVTLPNFGLRMSKAVPQTDAMMIQYLPLVQPWQRADWEKYAWQQNAWVNETMTLQETWDGFYGNIIYNWTAQDFIYGDDGDIEANVRYVRYGIFLKENNPRKPFLKRVFLDKVVPWLLDGRCFLWFLRYVIRQRKGPSRLIIFFLLYSSRNHCCSLNRTLIRITGTGCRKYTPKLYTIAWPTTRSS